MEKLSFRFANENDVDVYYRWANDSTVRQNSYNQNEINYANHVFWFKSKLISTDCKFYLFSNNENQSVGQVRIDKSNNETVVGISIDENHRGKGYATEMLLQATTDYLSKNKSETIVACIKTENTSSYKSFIKAGFGEGEIVKENNVESYKLKKRYQ